MKSEWYIDIIYVNGRRYMTIQRAPRKSTHTQTHMQPHLHFFVFSLTSIERHFHFIILIFIFITIFACELE